MLECFCKHDLLDCDAKSPNEMFVCTRPHGHEGEHIACGNADHVIATWPNESTEEKATK